MDAVTYRLLSFAFIFTPVAVGLADKRLLFYFLVMAAQSTKLRWKQSSKQDVMDSLIYTIYQDGLQPIRSYPDLD